MSETPTEETPAIQVSGLIKRYAGKAVVSGVGLTVARGEVLALLGPNGAGKTTTVEILEGYIQPDAGDVSVLGVDPWKGGPAFKDRIGIVLQSCGFDPYQTVAEAIRQRARWYRNAREVEDVVDLVGLHDCERKRIQLLSGGQQRRLDLGLALVGYPEVLFLDEPTTGFDPSARRSAWEAILRFRATGTSILLTTHYLEEARALADRVAVLVNGSIVLEGSPDSLGAGAHIGVFVTFTLPRSVKAAELPVSSTVGPGRLARVDTTDLTRTLADLTRWARRAGVRLDDLEIHRPSLEDAYLQIVDQWKPSDTAS